eukprot:3943071-Amphidinium_carterae.1
MGIARDCNLQPHLSNLVQHGLLLPHSAMPVRSPLFSGLQNVVQNRPPSVAVMHENSVLCLDVDKACPPCSSRAEFNLRPPETPQKNKTTNKNE